ncbi:hypothetical protein [uncultured Desulfovibrio sp.]|uniref:hypothetical protein n=1 Tax=uncultured Desulfovibrio sp. TaxID=167968 RepID=UPI00261F6E14|nr:hypothetical protein [uncultured Desulfovibrio sp.]
MDFCAISSPLSYLSSDDNTPPLKSSGSHRMLNFVHVLHFSCFSGWMNHPWQKSPFCRTRRKTPFGQRVSGFAAFFVRLHERFNFGKGETRGGGTAPPGPK